MYKYMSISMGDMNLVSTGTELSFKTDTRGLRRSGYSF